MLIVAVLAAILGVATAARTTIPFQYSWRFHYGDDPTSPPESGPGSCNTAFEKDLHDFPLCTGMEQNPNRFSQKDCRIACCYDPNCMVWQAFPIEKGRQCYHGYGTNHTCTKGKSSGMGGGLRKAPPSPAFRTDYSFAHDVSSGVDSAWRVVDAPHDFIAEFANFTDNSEDFKQGYLPRNASWYRKHFALPAEWQDDGVTYVHFEGVFHHTTIFLNGEYLQSHECGYTGFTVRLDNATGVRFGGKANVLAVRADASFGSGHWYEGGGLYRPVHMVHVDALHIVHDGLFAPPEFDPLEGAVHPTAELQLVGSSGGGLAIVRFTLLDGAKVLATNTSAPIAVGGAPVVASVRLAPAAGELRRWSIADPAMYKVRAECFAGDAAVGDAVDMQEVDVGFRTTAWSSEDGFALNGAPLRFRGFSHHNSIGGLGVAIPERVELFRVQAARALGSNVWRMSHNPYTPALYSLLDMTGITSWDENRDYGAKYKGGAYAEAMHDMVKRDRSHPSVLVWSFCNEYECEQQDANFSGFAFRAAALSVDTTRPLTANGPAAPAALDVQGFSHSKNDTFVTFHKEFPNKPSVLSECCSCTSQRPDRSLPGCIASQNSPGLLPYVAGSLGVWTLMDYFGEPHGTGTSAWPFVSCDFGQFDIAGFPKPHAYWYSANWLQDRAASDPSRPPLPARTVVRLLSVDVSTVGHDSGTQHGPSEQLSGIVSSPFADLLLDGVSQGVQAAARDEFGELTTLSWDTSRVATRAPSIGADDASGCRQSFPTNASGVQCKGLTYKGAAKDAQECAKVCCEEITGPCNTWQFDTSPSTAKGCWIGNVPIGTCTAEPSSHGTWVGGQRAQPPPPGPWPFANATLVALESEGQGAKVLGSHTVLAAPANSTKRVLQLTLDVPSPSTGTGRALLLDGRDTALVRAAVVAPSGALISAAADRITWRVVSGAGRVAGIANGDPTSHEWLKSNAVDAWGGLARGMFTVTQDCTSPGREQLSAIDLDGGRGPATVHADPAKCNMVPIVVEASAPGLGSVRLSIPVSTANSDGAFAVAASTAGKHFVDGFSYLESFVG